MAEGVRSQRKRGIQVNNVGRYSDMKVQDDLSTKTDMDADNFQEVPRAQDREGEEGGPGHQHQVPRGSSSTGQARLILS
jgi:hypothetical protein